MAALLRSPQLISGLVYLPPEADMLSEPSCALQ